MDNPYNMREQSETKHLILREYLAALASKTLLGGWPEFTFVDAFSGPWESRATGFADTSFGIALDTLEKVQQSVFKIKKFKPKIRLIFCEKKRSSFEKLRGHCNEFLNHSELEIHCLNGPFEKLVPEIVKLSSTGFRLTFIDPTGWSGYALDVISPLISRREDEVIVNFMYDFINRFVEMDDIAVQKSLEPILGENFRVKISARSGGRQEAIASLFRENLKHAGNFKYTLTAPVSKPLANRPLFMLAYGTKKYEGLKTFRGIERKAMSAYASVRARVKQLAEEERTRQPSLLIDDDAIAKHEFEQGLLLVREEAIEFLKEVVFAKAVDCTFETAASAVLARYPLTESEFKKICVDLAEQGFLRATWKQRSQKARVPNAQDRLIVLT